MSVTGDDFTTNVEAAAFWAGLGDDQTPMPKPSPWGPVSQETVDRLRDEGAAIGEAHQKAMLEACPWLAGRGFAG